MAVKFFYDNVIDSDATFTFTSATNSLSTYLYDNNYDTRLVSSGSNDATPEVWTIEFLSAKTIDKILVANHNIKSGELEYWTGAAWASFTSAVSWSANSATNSYFAVTQVSTTKIRLTINTTITVNDEKRVGQIRAMKQIGEVETNPSEVNWKLKKKKRIHEVGTGGVVQVVFGEKYSASYRFTDASNADITLFNSLNINHNPFFIYPGGGDTTITDWGFRIQDMWLINYISDFKPNLKSNIFGLGYVIEITVAEV